MATSGKTSGQDENENSFVAGWSAAAAARLKVGIKRFGTLDKAASRAGITRQSLYEILRFDEETGQGSRPRSKTLEALCAVINADEDDIIGQPTKTTFGAPDHSRPLSGDVRIGDDEYSVIKRYNVDASAGFGRLPLDEGVSGGVAFARSWLIKRGIAADLAGLISVKGDSMTPTIQDGATVLVHLAEIEVKKTGVYVFNRAGETCVKRIVPAAIGGDGRPTTLVITSDNNEYPPEVITGPELNNIRIIGRVRSVLSDL